MMAGPDPGHQGAEAKDSVLADRWRKTWKGRRSDHGDEVFTKPVRRSGCWWRGQLSVMALALGKRDLGGRAAKFTFADARSEIVASIE